LELRQLARLFDGAKGLDDAVGGDEAGFVGLVRGLKGLYEGVVAGHGHVLALEADFVEGHGLGLFQEPVPVAAYFNDLEVGGLAGGLLDITEIGGQEGLGLGHQEVAGGAGEAGDITAVLRGGYQKGVQVLLRHGLPQSA
jgi:hypothetical protein